MTEYSGLDESALRAILDDCSSFEERRKIRAALRQLKAGVERAHSFHFGSNDTPGSRHLSQGGTFIHQEGSNIRKPTLGVRGISQTASPLHTRHPVIRKSVSESTPADNLTNIRRTLNLALAKTVKTQHPCSVKFQNGVAEIEESDSDNVFGSGLPSDRQLTNEPSVLKHPTACSGSRTYKSRACEAAVEPTTASDRSRFDDSEMNCCSEEGLQQKLSKSTDFVERRKLRNRLRYLREELNQSGSREKGGDVPPASMKLSAPDHTLLIDYDKIDTLEEFKTLLSVTEDYEEKRKIRNAMRQLRKRLELEKVKLSAGSRGQSSQRRQSADTGVRRGRIDAARRRLSEDVARSSLSSLLSKHDTQSSSRVSEDFGQRCHRGSKTSVTQSKEVRKENASTANTGKKNDVKTAHSTHLPLQQKHLQSGKDEDFLGPIKARLTTHEKFVSGNEAQRKDILTNTSKINFSKPKAITHDSADKSRQQNTKSARQNKEDKSVDGRETVPFSSIKVNKTQSVTNKHCLQFSSQRHIPTYKSSLLVKLNSDKEESDSVGKLIGNTKTNNRCNNRLLPNLDKLKRERLRNSSGKSSLQKEVSVLDTLETTKPGGIELHLTAVTESKPLHKNGGSVSPGFSSRAVLTDSTPCESDQCPTSDTIPCESDQCPTSDTIPGESDQCPTSDTIPGESDQCPTSDTIPCESDQCPTSDTTPGESDQSPTSDTTSGEHTLPQSVSALAGHANFKPLIFTLDPRPREKGLFRSHSDILPQTGGLYRRAYQSRCQAAKVLESKSDMEKAFVDILEDMDSERLVDNSLVSVGDRERTDGASADRNKGTNRLDHSAIPSVEEEKSSGGQRQGEDRGMEPHLHTLSECDKTKVVDEENNNAPCKAMDDVADSLAACSSDTTLVLSGDVSTPGVGESAITFREEEDGTTTVQQVSRTDTQDQTVTVKSKMYRTLSNAQAEERDTIVETTSSSPGGSTLKERDVVRTRKKITSRGSNYYQRSVQVTRRVKNQSGDELIQQDLCLESDNQSVSKDQVWGDRVITQVTLHQPAHLQQMLEEGTSVPKKSHATLVFNKLNPSKVSSGYGSVSEEEDREEILDVNNSRPKGCPEIQHALQDVEVDVGEAVLLECQGVADPSPSVSWYTGGKEIQEGDPSYSLHRDQETASLIVHSPQVSTQFCCVFRNHHGQAETKCSLTVHKLAWKQGYPEQTLEQLPKECLLKELSQEQVPPRVEEELKDGDVTEGHSLTLSCRLTHADSVHWYHDKTLLTQCQDFKQSYDGCLAKLEISEMFLDDIGEYACVARNQVGEARTACQITVTACDCEMAVVPMFLTLLESQTLSIGDKLILQCDVIGSPEPQLTWTKDGCTLRDDCAYNEMFDGRTAKLEIEDLQVVDSGRYECVAVNEAGKVSNDTRITVKVKNKGPSITEPLFNLSIKSGETAALECQVTGFPKPCIIWRKNGMMIGQTMDFKQSYKDGKATLEICSACPQDSGRYECVARNTLGETSTSSSLIVSNVSSPVEEIPASSVLGSSTIAVTSDSWTPTRPSHIPLTSSSSHPRATASSSSTSSPVNADIITRALTRSASHHTSSNRSSSPPQTIIQRALDKVKSISPTSVTSGVPGNVEVEMETRSLKISSGMSPRLGRAAPQNTIGKFLALAAARDLEETKSFPVRTSLDTKPVDSIAASTDINDMTKSNEPPQNLTASRDVINEAKSAESKQHLSKVQQLRLQFLRGSDQSLSSNSHSAPIRRWHSLPPQDLRPTIIKREHKEPGGGKKGPVNMPSYDDINDEEELMKIMAKTDDFDERKKLRARLKEVREKDKLEREARRQQREKEAGDVVKLKYEKAEEDKRRRMQQFSDMAVKPGTQTTTETKTGADGSSTTTTTTTSTSKTQDGGTRMQTVKKTETTVTKTSGLGGVQYAKPGAEETARKLSDHLKTVSSPGTSGRIAVTTESWSSRDGLRHKSEKTETWGAKPGGARGAMAAFKQMDATNSPAQPNAGRGRGMTRSPSAIKQMLLDWCRSKTKEYENIEITNFSSCWNNGMAFCALIHHFFPDAFDYYALNPKSRRYNFDLAFDTAEKMADIAPLLDTDDMVKMKNPDWKCVFTYVQSIYRHLRDHDANKAKEQ